MGNCIGKKSRAQTKHYRYSFVDNEENKIQIQSILSDQTNIKFSLECIKLETNNSEKHFNEEDITMGFLFSKETKQQEINSESLDTSPSPSSFSSLSSNSTSFLSEDQLILSSSLSSIDTSSTSLTNKIFSPIFPTTNSRYNKDLFHQNIISHNHKTLSSVINNIKQQESIRIHQKTDTILIEHQHFQCIHINDINKFETPSFIFNENENLVYITKHANSNELQSLTTNIENTSQIFSSCDHCLSLLSGWKVDKCIRSFLIVNTTYNLIKICFNDINKKKNLFGYISQIQPNRIQQIIINNSKLNYSDDLDINYTNFYFVLRVHSWPDEMRLIYEKRQRLWPLNIENLFHNTCFIRYRRNEYETSTNKQCFHCEKILSLSDSSWSYTYTAIEAQLVNLMSDGHIRFASIVWNYLNGKMEGKFSFHIFKHILFYFFEQYSSDSFLTSDLFSYISLFIDFLFNRIQTKFIPHYFNSNYNLYNEKISMNFISFKMTCSDFKNSSIYILPKSSLDLYHLIYLIQFQSNFLQFFHSSKTNLTQTILDRHELVTKQLSLGVKIYKRQLDSTVVIKSNRPLTLDCLYRYQEENVQMIVDYLSLLRETEPSLLIHSLWSIFIQYFNCLFDDLFIS